MAWGTLIGSGLGAGAGAFFGGPVGAGVGTSLGGAVGGFVEGAFDDPSAPAAPYVDPAYYDTSGLDSISADAKARADAAARREGFAADWGMSDQDRALALDARNRQMGLADDLEAYLRGDRVSLAEQQRREGQIRAANEGTNLAASARGGAGAQILAQQGAQQQQTAAMLQGNREAAQLRAQEEAAARGQLAGLLGQTRGQDLSMRGQSQGQAQFDVEAQYRNRDANDAQQRFYDSLRLQGQQSAAQVKLAQGSASLGSQQAVLGYQAAADQQKAQSERDLAAGLTSGGMGVAQLGMQSSSKPAPAPAPAPAPQQASPWQGYGSSDVVDPWDPKRRMV